MSMRTQRQLAVVGAGILATAVVAAAAGVTSVSLVPSTQSHPHGQALSWTGSWSGGPAPYVYRFNRGDGTAETGSTSATSKNFSWTYWPCYTTTDYQTLAVTDADGARKVSNQTQSTEQGGSPC